MSLLAEVPILLHADEGKWSKQRSIWVISWSSALVHDPATLDSMWLYCVSASEAASARKPSRQVR